MGVGTRVAATLLLCALAATSVPSPGRARVEVTDKAVWAWSFMNTVDWCGGCPDPVAGRPAPTDDLAFQNYFNQIADGAAAGVSVFLLDTAADDPTALDKPRLRRVQLFADAARAYNGHPEMPRQVCVAVLYDNQEFTPLQQQEFFAAADGPALAAGNAALSARSLYLRYRAHRSIRLTAAEVTSPTSISKTTWL